MTRIRLLTGSTRPGRKHDTVARWVHDPATQRNDAAYETVDLVDYDLWVQINREEEAR